MGYFEINETELDVVVGELIEVDVAVAAPTMVRCGGCDKAYAIPEEAEDDSLFHGCGDCA